MMMSDNTDIWHDDQLQRESTARLFTKISQSVPGGSVFLVHAGFGMGKTFFAERWSESLRSQGHALLSFDAWKHDFSDNPLAAFISSINEQISFSDEKECSPETKKKLIDFSKKAAPVLLRAGTRVAARMLTLGAVDGDIDTLKEVLISEGISEGQSNIEEYANSFSKVTSQRAMYESLGSSFSALIDEIGGDDERVVVIIDELDRCRPAFVFDFLEDIKHILSCSKAVFFVFCDEGALLAQASVIFGNRVTGEKYLTKFFSQKLRLPEVSRIDFGREFVRGLSVEDRREFTDSFAANALPVALSRAPISLRQIESSIQFSQIIWICDRELFQDWQIVVFLLAMREGFPSEYERLGQGLGIDTFPDCFMGSDEHGISSRVIAAIGHIFEMAPRVKLSELSDFEDREAPLSQKQRDALKFISRVSDGFWRYDTVGDMFQKLIRRIEVLGSLRVQ
jgi:hypothetical protein